MKSYVYKNTMAEIEKASSGGAFSRILSALVDSFHGEYVIYGAAWTDALEVRHQRVESIKAASKFRESKYVMSNLGGIYIQVLQDLLNDKNVIFSGTPCQIQSLKTYLLKNKVNTERLFTIDIICHGSPKPQIWKDCKKWFEYRYKSNIAHVSFRDKRKGWRRYPTSIRFTNGKEIINTYESQIYMRMFFSLLILEEKCFSCKFSNLNRVSDITLGDFWGINQIIPNVPVTKGVSLILANTEKGMSIIKNIMSSLSDEEILKEYIGNEYLKFQHNLNKPTDRPENYEEFWKDYNEKGFLYIIEKYKFSTTKGHLKFFVKSILLKFKYFDNCLS